MKTLFLLAEILNYILIIPFKFYFNEMYNQSVTHVGNYKRLNSLQIHLSFDYCILNIFVINDIFSGRQKKKLTSVFITRIKVK